MCQLKNDDTKERFYEEQQHVIFDQLQKYHMKIFRTFQCKDGRVVVLKPTIRSDS